MYTYLAIGDSLTTGRGSNRGGFVPVYKQMLARRLKKPLKQTMMARSGFTCSEIVRHCMTPANRRRIFSADIITITAGGNDLLQALQELQRTGSVEVLRETSQHVNQCLQKLLDYVCEVKKSCPRPYIIRVFTFYNPIPNVPLLDQQLAQLNRSLYSLERYQYVRVVEIGSIFYRSQDELLSRDRIHPNQSGYDAMAHAAIETGIYPL